MIAAPVGAAQFSDCYQRLQGSLERLVVKAGTWLGDGCSCSSFGGGTHALP